MKIVFHSTAWKRPAITRLSFRALERLRGQFHDAGHETYVVVGVSDDESRSIAEDFGYHTELTDNEPLGKKFDETMLAVMKYDFDYVIEYPSDTIVCEEYVDLVLDLMEFGSKVIQPKDVYLMDSRTLECRLMGLLPVHTNSARAISRDIIEALYSKKGQCYRRKEGRHLDYHLHNDIYEICRVHPVYLRSQTPLVIDVKSDVNMNKYSEFVGKKAMIEQEAYPVVELVGGFPEIVP